MHRERTDYLQVGQRLKPSTQIRHTEAFATDIRFQCVEEVSS